MNYQSNAAMPVSGIAVAPRLDAPRERLPRPDMILMAVDNLHQTIRDLEGLSGVLLGEQCPSMPPQGAKQTGASLCMVLDTAPSAIDEATKRINAVINILRERLI